MLPKNGVTRDKSMRRLLGNFQQICVDVIIACQHIIAKNLPYILCMFLASVSPMWRLHFQALAQLLEQYFVHLYVDIMH